MKLDATFSHRALEVVLSDEVSEVRDRLQAGVLGPDHDLVPDRTAAYRAMKRDGQLGEARVDSKCFEDVVHQ